MSVRASSKSESNESLWSRRIKAHADGGQSVAAYCTEQGLSVATFYWWKAKLRKSQGLVKAKGRSVVPFIDLGSIQEPSLAPVARTELDIHLDLGGGMTLTITRR